MKKILATPLNTEAADNGTMAHYHGMKFCIARGGNEAFKIRFAALTRPYRRAMESNTLDEKVMLDLMCKSLSETILVGWDTFKARVDGGTEEIEYSRQNAYDLLYCDEDLREFVVNFANDINNYLLEDEDDLQEKLG